MEAQFIGLDQGIDFDHVINAYNAARERAHVQVSQNRGDASDVDMFDLGLMSLERLAQGRFSRNRGDAAGVIPALMLTQRARQVMETPRPPLDGFFIPHRAETAIGAQFTEYLRYEATGEIAQYIKGQPIPLLNRKIESSLKPVCHFVSAVEVDYFDSLADNFSGLNIFARDMANALQIHWQGHNQHVFTGVPTAGLYGLLTQPGIAESYAFTNPFLPGTTGETIVSEIGTWLDYLRDNTSDIGNIDTVMMASKLMSCLENKTFSTLVGKTVMQLLRERYPDITWLRSPKLNASGPGGQHGMFGFLASDMMSAYADMVQPPTVLAPEVDAFTRRLYILHTFAGFKSFNSYNAIRGFVPHS